MKTTLRSVSALAIAFGASGLSLAHAQTVTTSGPQEAAQQAASQPVTIDQQSEATADNRVTVIGSLIATTPEDAPKPVEVITAQDLQNQGAPTVSDFVRSLSLSFGDDLGFGQSNADNPQGAGFASPNLRGVGSSGTLTLLNGRRTVATNGGFGADLNTIPSEALEAVEILKDGASATYGAGAVGGVINFRTRRDINAPQVTVEKTMYDGSNGAYKIDFLTGWVGDGGNFMLSMSNSHEDAMLATERDFSSLPFNINPSGSAWALTPGNPGRFHTSNNFLSGVPAVSAQINDFRTAADCQAVGGEIISNLQINSTSTVASGCGFPVKYFQDLISENDNYRVYAEVNANLSDSMEFHADVSYSKNETTQQRVPIGAPTNRSTDGTVAAGCATTSCNYVIPVQVNTYSAAGAATTTAVRNPFIDDFITRTGTTAGALPTTGALYTSNSWRPFLFGGTPLTDNGLRQERIQRDQYLINAGLKGEFTEGTIFGFMNGIKYDHAVQLSMYEQENIQPDVSVARLQNALLGYGGANCQAVDRVATDYTTAASFNRTVGIQSDTLPGTNGCQWFNPFASGWSRSIANGAANPQYNTAAPTLVPGSTARPTYANPFDLVDWMTFNRQAEDHYLASTYDGTLTGELPVFELPGGPISWAAGTQVRLLERRSITVDPVQVEETMNLQPCPYPDGAVVNTPSQPAQQPGMRGCATASGAFFGSGQPTISLRSPTAYSDSQLVAFFGELQLPVLDNLNFSVSARQEDFNGGDLSASIWSVAGKYNFTDNFYVRASYGTNYRAEAALDTDPGVVTFSTSSQTRFNGTTQLVPTATLSTSLGPEDDTTFNVGAGYEGYFGELRTRASVDFWEININGQVITTPIAGILTNVFGAGTGTAGSPLTANCNASLIGFIDFFTPCQTGVSTGNDIRQVNLQQLNGPYFVTNGIDYALDLAYPLFDGTIAFNFSATQNLVYKQGGYDVNGIVFDTGGDRLGFNNLTRTGNVSTEWRGNASLRWSNDIHSINVRANYIGGTYTEAYGTANLVSYFITPSTAVPDIQSLYGVQPKDNFTIDLNYIYTAPFWEELQLRASVLNVTDKDPMPAQTASGYYPGIGDPRGRTLELSVTKKF